MPEDSSTPSTPPGSFTMDDFPAVPPVPSLETGNPSAASPVPKPKSSHWKRWAVRSALFAAAVGSLYLNDCLSGVNDIYRRATNQDRLELLQAQLHSSEA